ncbi:MAG: hypothetical protein GC134_01100 [Proteobacteria bacterium]|nr:hypothetical protein [Pseudomonadota bacterium]
MLRTLPFQLSMLLTVFTVVQIVTPFMTEWHFFLLLDSIRYVIWTDFLFALIMLVLLHKVRGKWVRKGLTGLFLPATLFFCLFTVPALLRQHVPAAPPAPNTLRLMVMNINAAMSETPAHVADKVHQLTTVTPDIAVILESTPDMEHAAEQALGDALPYRHTVRGLMSHPTTVLSRYPIRPRLTIDDTSPVYDILLPQGYVTLVAAHPLPPISPGLREWRDRTLSAISLFKPEHPLIVMGDFNTVQWDDAFKNIQSKQGLKRAHNWMSSWLSVIPAVPIDHILVPQTATVSDSGFVFVKWSDHLSIWADIALHP